ncbi:DUF4386 domain-containing protein [Yonghaparkia sp. Root332]|uniref:DUF4386 domain-containing protein n=1 Tax=Yonghaparkia sp. Root332 TaxID=1736516 RepID=UPI0006F36AC5|nr:DUF4386 domain-containing protein [Yonghaparkia sp. Root332]KQV24658.1 hypothetical protein ASC54_09055 [Yonghaparkia sp. Root332]
MTPDRRLALWAGILYLATFATSFPALALKTPILAGEPQLAQAAVGTALEIALAFTCIGTAVALHPIARRVSEPLAIGFVASRTVEAGMILSGAIALLALIELGPDSEGASVLIELHDAAFLLGPAFMASINAALLGTVMLRGRLVPRVIPLIGLIGAPLLLASSFGVVLGAWDQLSVVGALTALPIAAWELSLGLWLTIRGVRMPAPATADPGVGDALPATAGGARV